MRHWILILGMSAGVGLFVQGGRLQASELEQCESKKVEAQQRYALCEKIQLNSASLPRERARALLQIGRLVQWQTGGIERAIGAWEGAIAADPTFAPAIIARAEWHVLYNNGHEAIKLISPVLAANPDNIDLHVMIGRAYANVRLFDQALSSFETALRLAPDHVNALFEMGKVFEQNGQFAQAAAAYEKAGAKYDPSVVPESGHGIEHPYLAAARSYAYIGDVGSIAKAVMLTGAVVDRGGADVLYALEQRAGYHEALGSDREAISDLTAVLRRAQPNEHAPLLFRRAVLYQHTGMHQEAEEDFSRALRIGDRRTVLRMQVYLRNQGYAEVDIDGEVDPVMLKSISACLSAPKCVGGLGKPI